MNIWIHFKLIQGILKNKNRCTMSYSDFTEETTACSRLKRHFTCASLQLSWAQFEHRLRYEESSETDQIKYYGINRYCKRKKGFHKSSYVNDNEHKILFMAWLFSSHWLTDQHVFRASWVILDKCNIKIYEMAIHVVQWKQG